MTACLLGAGLLLTGCGPGQMFGPTLTPTPTLTLTPTETATPLPTDTPTVTPAPTSTSTATSAKQALATALVKSLGGFPGESIASTKLQTDVFLYISIFATVHGCSKPEVINTLIVDPLADDKWSERWIIDQCGSAATYLVKFTLVDDGATFAISEEK